MIKQLLNLWRRKRAPAAPSRPIDFGALVGRMYATARASRLTNNPGASNTSADAELSSSLRIMRSRSRALVRDAAYAKRAKIIVQNNVIGQGIGMQAQVMTTRNALNERVNASIEDAWEEWARGENCHTGGELDFADLERQCIGQVFEAGEVLIRKHYSKFGNSKIPLALELIEAERIADEFQFPTPPARAVRGNILRMGVEVDRFYRPMAYWLRARHPGELRIGAWQSDALERVPADQIIHLRLIDRWPQTRGEPWMHAAIRKLNDMDGYSEAEIVAARAAACYMGIIQSPEGDEALGAKKNADGSIDYTLESGVVLRLNPGETFNSFSPQRPNSAMDPFMRLMLREVSAGIGPSYESVSGDYSQSNYSSSRLGKFDERDLWRVLQRWFIRRFRQRIHRDWLQTSVLANAIPAIDITSYALDPAKYEAVRFKPRGWSWIDPTKEVQAARESVNAGFTTVDQVVAQNGDGMDYEDVLNARERELAMAREKNLVFETSPEFYTAQKADSTPVPKPGDVAAAGSSDTPANQQDANANDPQARVVSFSR